MVAFAAAHGRIAGTTADPRCSTSRSSSRPARSRRAPLLPSLRYHPAPGELAPGDLALPWAPPAMRELPRGVIGELAQPLGAQVPGRLVASAKSWLCHAGVDRQAPILPWGAPDDVPKVSPVDASASYLAHVRAAWDHAHPEAPLAAQEVVLTVPASFDEAARALTLEAARARGPAARAPARRAAGGVLRLARSATATTLADGAGAARGWCWCCDVGGGTTDLTLDRASSCATSGSRGSTRIAVGDHLLLGGDNMDLALAHLCEPALARRGRRRACRPARFAQLVEQLPRGQGALLARDAPEQVRVTLLGARLEADRRRALDDARAATRSSASWSTASFPHVAADDAAPRRARGGLVEFGLPYAAIRRSRATSPPSCTHARSASARLARTR